MPRLVSNEALSLAKVGRSTTAQAVDVACGRRAVLAGGVVAAGAATGWLARPAYADSRVFRHGVASGDPLPTAVVLWTRVTPSDQAAPGSGLGEPVSVDWEIALDENFAQVRACGTEIASAGADHTVKVDAGGLEPHRDYFYRFRALGQISAVGRTRTAPADSAEVDRLRFGVVSCANWEAGFFSAYRHLAAHADLDAIVHLGDYLYEYARGLYGGRGGSVRWHEPAHEIVALADYRVRHAQYKTDPDLVELHGRYPFICIWDDHEIADNAWSGGAGLRLPFVSGDWQARRAAAQRAYLEWMPVRANGSGPDARLYRRLRFGTLAELSMLDLRSYRSRQATPAIGWGGVDDPTRSITGKAQMDWLTAGLASAPTRWKLVGNPVMIMPLVLPPLNPDVAAALHEVIGMPEAGVPALTDQWDGYAADRRRLLDTIHDNSITDILFLTGDIHSSWVAELPVDLARYPDGGRAGVEFVVPSITARGVGDTLPAPYRTVSVAVEEALKSANPHLRHVELDSHGYGVLDLVHDRARMEWFYVTDVADPKAAVRQGASFELPAASLSDTGLRAEAR
ncbi:alkaline phosphatase D family protein [Nocardia sp. NPDC050406]|uniref:alkaline phosphatase D family protein n=1 Tax=Nocardia sp. NPDC050406 TaxID=3364318 RepID=UPI0037BCF18C